MYTPVCGASFEVSGRSVVLGKPRLQAALFLSSRGVLCSSVAGLTFPFSQAWDMISATLCCFESTDHLSAQPLAP